MNQAAGTPASSAQVILRRASADLVANTASPGILAARRRPDR